MRPFLLPMLCIFSRALDSFLLLVCSFMLYGWVAGQATLVPHACFASLDSVCAELVLNSNSFRDRLI
jgi:hypothetical protein